jgi:parallel beta-helix repeat protein
MLFFKRILLPVIAGLSSVGLILILANVSAANARGGSTLFVSEGGTDAGDCSNSFSPCGSLQYAIDQAEPGYEIRLSEGSYTGVHSRPAPAGYDGPSVITQVAYISKSLTIAGGYSNDFSTNNPEVFISIIDAEANGRALVAFDVNLQLGGIVLLDGDALGLAGGNLSLDAGGLMFLDNVTADISKVRFQDGSAVSGGGAYATQTDGTWTDTAWINNTTVGVGDGGGLHLRESDDLMIEDSLFSDNFGHSGGGLYIYHSEVVIRGNTFINNEADENGGGVHFANGDPLETPALLHNDFTANIAEKGGGISIAWNDALLDGNVLRNNIATESGAGIRIFRCDPIVRNNVVVDNSANIPTVNGIGIYIDGGDPSLVHNTIARNNGGDGSGIGIGFVAGYESSVSMVNTIVVSQSTGISVSVGTTATLDGVLWHDVPAATDGGGLISVSNAISADPKFAVDGYHLSPLSTAARDAGVESGVTSDVDGETRPRGSGYDLGADEFTAAIAPIVTLLGPPNGATGEDQDFLGIVSPSDIAVPLTYTWEASGFAPFQLITDTLSAAMSFSWSISATQHVTLTVQNAFGESTKVALIDIQVVDESRIYLPIVRQDP